MGSVSLRLNEKDDKLIRTYAEMHQMDLSSFIRQAVLEKIEDEYDLALFDKIWEEAKSEPRYTLEDVEKELGI
ncbi:MAG: DUF6290 family protein [Firmicutes bacterium]|jgi:hypothetical protein|nr:DUF6290 family protein [Bacillota bacterium]